MRIGVVAALWAALAGAFLAAKYRRQVNERTEDAVVLQKVYELELEREITARREFELEIEADARAKVDEKAGDELAELREELKAMREYLETLLGGEVLVERFALRAEATRMRSLTDGEQRSTSAQQRRIAAVKSVSNDGDTDQIERIRTEAPPRKGRVDARQSDTPDQWFLDGANGERIDPNWTPSWESGEHPRIRIDKNGRPIPPDPVRQGGPARQAPKQAETSSNGTSSNGTSSSGTSSVGTSGVGRVPLTQSVRPVAAESVRHPSAATPRPKPAETGRAPSVLSGRPGEPVRHPSAATQRPKPAETSGVGRVPPTPPGRPVEPVRQPSVATQRPKPAETSGVGRVPAAKADPSQTMQRPPVRAEAEPVAAKTDKRMTPVSPAQPVKRRLSELANPAPDSSTPDRNLMQAPTGTFPPLAASAAMHGRRAAETAQAEAERTGQFPPAYADDDHRTEDTYGRRSAEREDVDQRVRSDEGYGRRAAGMPRSELAEPARPDEGHRTRAAEPPRIPADGSGRQVRSDDGHRRRAVESPRTEANGHRAAEEELGSGRRRRAEGAPSWQEALAVPAGSHTEGKSVAELLAEHRATPTTGRRRRRDDE
jgi:hypothetical protein